MQKITPFAIPSEPKFELELPRAAVILDVSVMQGQPYFWIQHDEDAILIWRTFLLIPAGKFIPTFAPQVNVDLFYIGNFNIKNNKIFIFEEIEGGKP